MNKLGEISRIREEIKHIARIVEGIGQTAADVALAAKPAGDGAAGHGAVARECRVFSERMAHVMQGMPRLAYGLADRAAQEALRARRLRCLRAADGRSGRARGFIAAACEASLGQWRACGLRVGKLAHELLMALQQVERQCAVGMAVGRLARIEAARADARQPVLSQLAEDVDAAIAEILGRVRGLQGRLAEFAA